MPTVYVSIGSNIDRNRHTRAAVHTLRRQFGPVTTSSVYESAAEGFAGDNFYNLVAAFDTYESVVSLRTRLAEIEAANGRQRGPARFASRTLDIDILLYGDMIRHDAQFDIPRAEILRHAYVLAPLAELAPQVRHPETGTTFADLWQRFVPKETVRKVAFDFGS